MTPTDEAFIALWQQGLETAAIAERLNITARAAQSRARVRRPEDTRAGVSSP
jgi:hypothetical protein